MFKTRLIPLFTFHFSLFTLLFLAAASPPPADDPNDPPEPPTLEGRVVSGDSLKVRVPGVGVDRNGDPVMVTGITSAPRLGRIQAIGGNFIEYQAFPRTVGTDEFSYSVVDSQGAFAIGKV